MRALPRLPVVLLVLFTLVSCTGGDDEDTEAPSPTAALSPTRAPAALVTPSPTPDSVPGVPSGALLFRAASNLDLELYRVNADGTGLVNLTQDPSADPHGAWSPDGTRIAFASTRDGELDVFVMDADGGNVRNITNTPDLPETFVSWSPDGARILFGFFNEARGEYWVMNADGTNRSQVIPSCFDCFDLQWSPDGSCFLGSVSGPGHEDELYLIDTDGRNRTVFPGLPDSPRNPLWSPDGRQILFVAGRDSRASTVFVMNADGTDVRQIYGPATVGQPTWSPDGSHIAIGGGAELITIAPDGTDPRVVASGSSIREPVWSPDGSRIAYRSSHEGNSEVYVVPAEGGTVINVSNGVYGDAQPRWSPDGSQLLFRSDRDSRDGLYWMRLDGTAQTLIEALPPRGVTQEDLPDPPAVGGCRTPAGREGSVARAGCYSPDGRTLAKYSSQQGGEWALVLLDVFTDAPNDVTPPGVTPEVSPPAWSPDGRAIAFYGREGDEGWLYVLDTASGTARRLAPGDALGNPTPSILWSTDGAYIYYTRDSRCRGGCSPGFLHRVRPDGTGEERLSDLRVLTLYGFAP